jgi:hypothetical protein
MELALALPVLPGKRTALEELAKTISGPRKKEFDASERKFGARKESWFLQSTPQGDLCICYMEADDVPKSVAAWAASKDPIDLWVKAQIKEITGIDFSNLPAGAFPAELLRYGY